jgi:hypothetical protein
MMALNRDDPRPDGISIKDAYAAIRAWYQANVDIYASDPQRGHHAVASKAYIESLLASDRATQKEMEDTLRRVLADDLEWAYHESDGRFKMAAYAEAAFETAGVNPFAD